MNYGIEFEFFIRNAEFKICPAFLGTRHLDGNSVVGELRTDVHSSIVDAVFQLKKLIFLEKEILSEKGFTMSELSTVKVNNDFLKKLRESEDYINTLQQKDFLKEFSIYPNGKKGKILPRGVFKSSLQISLSENSTFSTYSKETKYGSKKENYVLSAKTYSTIFNYISPISILDKLFEKEILSENRVKGVFAIKDGRSGNRIEYRSLPSNISLDKLLTLKIDTDY